jgi:hypothetical protein
VSTEFSGVSLDAWKTILIPAITLGAGFVSGWFATYYRLTKEFRLKIDEKLRDQRINVYKSLWARLEELKGFNRPPRYTYEQLKELSIGLTRWYFDSGNGLLLSRSSMDAYIELQEEIKKAFSGKNDSEDMDQDGNEQFKKILQQASKLRTRLTADIGGRIEFKFR